MIIYDNRIIVIIKIIIIHQKKNSTNEMDNKSLTD